MSKHIHDRLDEYLNAWLDGELGAAERLAFEAHIRECPGCRDELAAAEQLHSLAGNLASEIEPPRDLWPEISARLEPRSRRAALSKSGWPRAVAAAAVFGLVFAGGMLADRFMQAGNSGPDRMAEWSSARVSEQARTKLPEQYVQLVSNGATNPETRDTMLRNLLIVNLAIRDVESALEDAPNDPHLRDMLRSLYTQENQILNRAERMASTRQENVRTGI